MHLHSLRKTITKSVLFVNPQIKELPREKLNINMPLAKMRAFHDPGGQHQQKISAIPRESSLVLQLNLGFLVVIFHHSQLECLCTAWYWRHFICNVITVTNWATPELVLKKKKATFTHVEMLNSTVVLTCNLMTKVMSDTTDLLVLLMFTHVQDYCSPRVENALLILSMWNVMRKGKCIK